MEFETTMVKQGGTTHHHSRSSRPGEHYGRSGGARDHHDEAGRTGTESKERLQTASMAIIRNTESLEKTSPAMPDQTKRSKMASLAVIRQVESSWDHHIWDHRTWQH